MSKEEEKQVADSSGGGGGGEEVPDPELDNLLDGLHSSQGSYARPECHRALSPLATDLASLVTAAGITAAVGGQEGQAKPADMWTEEFVQNATAQFEQTMRLLMEQQQQGGQEKPAATNPTPPSTAPAPASAQAPEVDLSSMATQFAQFAQAAAKSAEETKSDADFTHCLADTLKQISDNNEQLQTPPNTDDLTKMFETMGLSGGGGEAAGAEGGLGALFPLMQAMLENVLSKDVLYPSMKDITDKVGVFSSTEEHANLNYPFPP
ncbi:Peroxisomal biogenesis factor 19 [Chionoecetes opilio]|uniref:Peroxin-19 n=1 Tax=Chionoecetes opilio TaxID=41210 RepID=A0A8J4Y3E3_CHIOP|nr:Peroxisomal biogenesis factor 19 [Chionoecetes opilio]